MSFCCSFRIVFHDSTQTRDMETDKNFPNLIVQDFTCWRNVCESAQHRWNARSGSTEPRQKDVIEKSGSVVFALPNPLRHTFNVWSVIYFYHPPSTFRALHDDEHLLCTIFRRIIVVARFHVWVMRSTHNKQTSHRRSESIDKSNRPMWSWVRSQKLERFTDEYSARTFFETKPNSFRRQSYSRTELSASPPGERGYIYWIRNFPLCAFSQNAR